MKLSEVAGPDPSSKPMKLSDLTKDSGDEVPSPYASLAAGGGDPNLSMGDVGEMAQGVVKGALGGPGAIEQFVTDKLGMGDEGTILPTPEDVGQALGFDQPQDDRSAGYETLGEVISPGVYGSVGKLAKAAKGLTAGTRAAKLGGEIASGDIGKSVLAAPRAAAAARRAAADTAYAQADTAMAAKQAATPWQEHPSGRAFLDGLEDRIKTIGETKETAGTRADLQKIHDDLLGGTDPSGGTAYSQPTVIREVLRKLRDRAAGVPETGFDAIAQQRAGDLADDLAKSVSDWEPSLAKADDKYRELSEKLYPKGVEPGKFAQEFEDAKGAINTLEKQVKDGTIPSKDSVKAVRDLLRRETVTRLTDSKTAQALNKRLDSIEKSAERGKIYRRVGAGAVGVLGGGALGRSLGIFGSH